MLSLFPSSWPLLAVDAAASGDYASAAGLIGALALVTALVVAAAVALLTPYVGNRTTRRRGRPWGSRVLARGRILPGTPLGAVVGKELRTWWRDPWRSLEIRSSIWFGIFVAIYGVIGGIPQLAGLAGIAVALMVGLSGANLFGQDGTALWQLNVGQSPQAVRADIRGRQIGLVVTLGVPAFGLSLLMMLLTGAWDFAVPIFAVVLATLGGGSGIAVVMSVVGVTPGVDPHRRVNATDAGENNLSIQVALWSILTLVGPTVAVAVPLAVGGPDRPAWLVLATLAVAVVNGLVVRCRGGPAPGDPPARDLRPAALPGHCCDQGARRWAPRLPVRSGGELGARGRGRGQGGEARTAEEGVRPAEEGARGMTASGGPVASAGYGGTPPPERKLAPDLARGAMLLLIAMAYAGVYAGVAFGGRLPAGTSVADTVARFVVVLVLDNRAFPMFAVLYGYGLTWMVARRRRAGAADSEIRRLLRRRSLLLVAFGSVHVLLVFPGEILASYGLAGLVLGWLLFRSDRALARTIAVLVPCYVVTVTAAMVSLAAAPDVGGYAMPGYTTAADWSMRLSGVPFTPIFIAVAYPLLLLVVLGFRAGRSGLLDDPSRHRPLLIRIAVGGIAISLLGALPAALIAIDAVRPDIVSTGALLALQVLTGVLGGAGYAAAFGLLALRLDARRGLITRAVSAVGQRSLTFYLFNSVLVAVVLHHDLLAVGDRIDSIGALVVAAAVWLVALAVAAWMDRTGRPGPVDALLRRLVSGRRAHDQRPPPARPARAGRGRPGRPRPARAQRAVDQPRT